MSGRRIYQPPATEEQIHALWLLAQRSGRPMTQLLREALAAYLAAHLDDGEAA